LILDISQPTEFGVHLVAGLFPDMAGVEDHHIGILGAVTGRIAERRQNFRHTRGVVDIHLAAVGFYEKFLGQGP